MNIPRLDTQALMQKEFSRLEFLGLAAFTIGSLFGLGTIFKLFTGSKSASGTNKSTPGYGGTDYGK